MSTTIQVRPRVRRSRRALLTGTGLAVFLTATHAAIDAVSSMLSALLPTLQARFGLSEAVLAALVGTLWFSNSVTQPLFGALADRVGSRLIGAAGVVLTAALLALIGVAPSVWALFALLLVGGLGSAAFHPAAISMARPAGGARGGLAVSIVSAGGTLGLALGPVIVLGIVSTFGLGFTPWLMAPGVVLGVLMYFVVPAPAPTRGRDRRLFDTRLVAGPVGLLSLVAIFSNVSSVTFVSAIPLWMVATHDVARDSALLGWTLGAFNLSAALGGILAGALAARLNRRLLVAGTLLLAVPPLFAVFLLEPGTPLFLLAVVLAGALGHASLPVMIVSAQDMASDAMATASGMLMGFAVGTAGVLYVAVGWLQELIGLVPAMSVSYLLLVPAALLGFRVFTRHPGGAGVEAATVAEVGSQCTCAPCACVACALPRAA